MIIALAACSAPPTKPVATEPVAPSTSASASIPVMPPAQRTPGHVWVIGFAANAKAGAILDSGDGPVYCGGRDHWPDTLVGHPMIVDGTLSVVHHDEPLVDEHGNHMAGMHGDQWVVTPSEPPPPADDGLQDAERALAQAIARQDRAALERIIAPSFVLRIAGMTKTRDDLLKALMVPGVEAVVVSELASHRSGDVGVVSGVQTAKVHGADDRTYFVDVFHRDGERWILVAAYAYEPS